MGRPANTFEKILSQLIRKPPDRFPIGCWEWTGETVRGGYGRAKIRKKRFSVHRLVYEHLVGPIPEGHDLHHRCDNPCCAEPTHLEPLRRHEHTLLGNTVVAINHRKTHCVHGHPLSGANLRISRTTGERICITCRRQTRRETYYRQKAKHPRTHCAKGHELTPENVWLKSDGRRQCKICLAYGRAHGSQCRPSRQTQHQSPAN